MDIQQDSNAQLELNLDYDEDASKAAKLEEARTKVLQSVASARLDTLQERVAWILNHYPDTRDSDIALQLEYWTHFDSNIYNGQYITPDDLYQLTRSPSLQRARAKIQNTYKLFQASPKVRRQRGKFEESEKEKAVEQRPSYPIFAVYADESGKTDPYLVVGSLWFLHGPETATLTLEIEEWKKRRSFEGELHFKRINKSKLSLYKEVADMLAAKSSTISFKTISVKRAGIAKTNDALIDLYYLLLLYGANHEHETGRGELPRGLQLWKDAEESGFDTLLLENVHDRIMQAGRSRFDGKLQADHFEAVSSRNLTLIQLADLFTSSVSRVLNATGERKNHKDEFADYLLKVVGMPGGPAQTKIIGDVTYHLSL